MNESEWDEIARYNINRWKALVEANALWTRPWFQLDPEAARARVDARRAFGELTGKRVLLVAGGGGQQSAAFAMLGAHVTVTDLSEDQLARDQAVAAHHGLAIDVLQADMRNLSALPVGTFDMVWHGYSINFVPAVAPVFAEIARVIRPGGLYRVECANPFSLGVSARHWGGSGYVLRRPYIEGAALVCEDPDWVYDRRGKNQQPAVPPAREYRHTLAAIVNGLREQGFIVEHLADQSRPAESPPEPGTWKHFVSVCPQWLTFITRYRPDLAGSGQRYNSGASHPQAAYDVAQSAMSPAGRQQGTQRFPTQPLRARMRSPAPGSSAVRVARPA